MLIEPKHKHRLAACPGWALLRGNGLRGKEARPTGSVLIVVLVVVAMMTVATMSFFDWSFTEHRAARMTGRQLKARALADSGIGIAISLLTREASVLEQEGGLYVNPSYFQGVLLIDDPEPALRGRVSLTAPLEDFGNYVGYRFGLENESSRLNLNTLLLADDYQEGGAKQQLMYLPGMTEAIADAILDWLDEDDEVRPLGAEVEYYSGLEEPYDPLNGPLESVEQLLLVRDVTPQMLYGLDTDRNHVVDAAEAAIELPPEIDNSDGAMNHGWAALLTLYSAESTLTPEGESKIDVNMEDLEELHKALEEALGREKANFIVAYRQGGAADDPPPSNPISPASVTIDFSLPGSETIPSLLDLLGVNVEFSNEGAPAVLQSPFPTQSGTMTLYLPELLDKLTVSSTNSLPGRLNINQAPRALVYSVPGMPPEVVEQIIASRSFEVTPDRPERRHAEWLLMDGLLTLEQMKKIAPLVTGGGDVYRVQSTGYFEAKGPAVRLQAVIDATQQPPVLLHKLDLTPLGAGHTAAELGVQAAADSP